MPGYFTPTPGNPIKTSEHNTYVRDQVISTFVNVAARDAAITSPTSGMHSHTTDTGTDWVHNGTSWLSKTTIPAGTLWQTISATAPTGWVLMTGQTLAGAQTAYPELWSVAPASWKSGSDLVVPNMGSRTTIGNGYATLGTTAGANTKTIATANLPAHTHSGTTGSVSADHTHGFSGTTSGQSATHVHGEGGGQAFIGTLTGSGTQIPFGSGLGIETLSNTASASADHTHTYSGNTGGISANHTHTFTSDNGTGSGTAIDIVPSVLVVNYMLKVH